VTVPEPLKGMNKQAVADDTRRWIRTMVIGLNLCPFARRVFEAGQIRFAVTEAADEEALRRDLAVELTSLASTPAVETTLLIHPRALGGFRAYVDFLGAANHLVKRLGFRGVIQIASFHPQFCFAGADPDAVENYTNRSPHPMLHLLREESVTEAAGDPAALAAIPRRNIETLRGLGRAAILARLRAETDPAG
jgi:hypothetical protein